MSAIATAFARVTLSRNLARTQNEGKSLLVEQGKLRPAEIAYLSSNGDISHALLVLGADLTQRALKTTLSENSKVPALAPYELRMWDLAKETIKDWAITKADQHLPMDIKKDPIEYARRVSKIYNFVVHTARHMVVKVLQDPRQIRRYFRMSAIATLIADFSTAGYKAAFEEEFKSNLLSRGLLVSSSRRRSYAKYYTVLAIAGALLTVTITFIFIQPWTFALGLVSMCLTSAVLLRFALLLLHSIPLYAEIAEVIGHLKRQSWRLQMLRILIRIITALTYSVVLIGFLVLTGIALAILTFGFHHSHIIFLSIYVLLTIAFILPVQVFIDGWRLNIEERPSAEGARQLSLIRHELAATSPLDSFKEVLLTTDYVPTFSELLAIYGIETLLILV
ncbi:MAG: hypothetical protein EKK48_03300 [Candidatus Melainabacteria bacterium]|nr:MAG: hypothetical protein EKK48_03300 [Candidatus Melainabacteria bacterium]